MSLATPQASVMRNSVVELVARPRRLEVLLNNLQGEKEMHWVNGHPVSRLYRCSPLPTPGGLGQMRHPRCRPTAMLQGKSWPCTHPRDGSIAPFCSHSALHTNALSVHPSKAVP